MFLRIGRTADRLHRGRALKTGEELRLIRKFLVWEINWIMLSLTKIENEEEEEQVAGMVT